MVAFDAVGPSSSGTHSATTPLTWTHTPVGTPTAILIGVTTFTGATNKVTSVTYGGNACSLIGFSESGGTAAAGGIALYGLLAPPSGAQTISVAFTGAASTTGGSISFTGPVSGFGTPLITNSVSSTSVSGSVGGTASGGMIGAVACQGSGTAGFAGSNSITVRYAVNVSASTAADNSVGGTVPSAGGSQTVGFTNPSADNWGLVAVEVIAASGSAAPVPLQPGSAVWRHRYRRIQQQFPLVAAPVSVNAGLATGTGAAFSPGIGITPVLATGTGTAFAPGIGITPALATATSAAFAPGIGITIGLATATGTAGGISQAANAGLAASTGTAFAPSIPRSAGLASGTGAANAPNIAFTPALATGTGTSFAPGYGITPGLATGTGTAFDITVQSPGVSAGLASATGAALAPSTPRATGLATGTGTASAPSAPRTAGLAAGTGTAFAPAVPRSIALATGTGAALAPSAPRLAGLATAAGISQAPVADLGIRHNVDYTGSTLTAPNTLGGTISVATLDGTLSVAANTLGGTASVNSNTLGGTASVFTLDGTASVTSDTLTGTLSVAVNTLGGTAVEDKMQEVDIILNEFNDATVTFQVLNNGSPMNITGMTVNAHFKKLRGDLDSAPTSTTYSSGGGSPAITIVTPTTGSCTLAIPDTDVIGGAWTFYRIDVVNGTVTTTAIFGTVTIILL